MSILKHTTIEIFKTLTSNEISRLSSFMYSPYFNKSKKIFTLYKEIIRYYPEFSNTNLNRERLGKLLNKKGIYKDSELRDYLSKLLSLVKEFLAIERLNQRMNLKILLILNELSERDLNPLFNKYYTIFKNELSNKGLDHEDFLTEYHLQAQYFNNLTTNSKVKKPSQAENEISKIDNCSKNLYLYFLMSLVSIYSNRVIHQKKFNIEKPDNFTRSLINSCEENLNKFDFTNQEQIITNLYLNLYKAFNDFEDIECYSSYKDLFFDTEGLLNYEEVKFHIARLISYCILQKKYSRNTLYWNIELQGLYKEFLGKKLYITKHEKCLSHNLYRDILINAINVNDLKWMDNFIEEYSEEINSKFKKNMKNYAMSYLHHKRKNYSKSIEFISKIDPDYFIYKYDIKNLKLVNFYELNEIDGLMDLIHAYEEALRKDKLLGKESKFLYTNFIYYLKKLVIHQTSKDLQFYYDKLLLDRNVTYRNWLLEKYEKLIS